MFLPKLNKPNKKSAKTESTLSIRLALAAMALFLYVLDISRMRQGPFQWKNWHSYTAFHGASSALALGLFLIAVAPWKWIGRSFRSPLEPKGPYKTRPHFKRKHHPAGHERARTRRG